MLDLLLFPFQLVWALVKMVFGLISGVFGLIFGLLGGLLELALTLAALAMLVGFVCLALQRRRADRAHSEDFTSFYDQDGTVE